MPDPVTLKTAAEAVTFASGQSDRWLFIALLGIFIAAIWLMTKWFMARDAAMQQRIDALQQRLDAQAASFNDFLQNRHTTMAGIVQRNTEVLEKAVITLNTAAELLKLASDNIERRKTIP